jgi:hypothetical protein
MPAFPCPMNQAGLQHVQALVVLESGLKHKPSSPSLRLALCAIASLLGHTELSVKQVQALQLRHVQLDSLAHHVLPVAAACSTSPLAGLFFRQVRCSMQSCTHVPLCHSFAAGLFVWHGCLWAG